MYGVSKINIEPSLMMISVQDVEFKGSDPVLLEKGVPALHIYFFGFCFMALQFTGQAVFVALGKAKRATFFSIFRKVIIVVPLTILLPIFCYEGLHMIFC